MPKSFLCRIGFHKWGRASYTTSFRSNVKDYKKVCERCGKAKRWVVGKR